MAFSKIIMNGTTLIDLTSDTVATDNLIAPNTAHNNAGVGIVGTASGGGGVDAPTFTITWDDNWEDVVSVTCDKTYAECKSYYENDGISYAMAIETDQSHTEEYTESVTYIYESATPSDHIVYACFAGTTPAFDINYYRSGTIELNSPSSLLESKTVTQNGTVYPSFNRVLESVIVNVSGSSKNIQIDNEYKQRTANSYGDTGLTLTVAKTGTYTVTWTAWRGSSSGTMGTNLYVNSTAGTNQQTWTGTYGQDIILANQSYTQGDVLTLYATSGSNSRSVYVANLMIIEQ